MGPANKNDWPFGQSGRSKRRPYQRAIPVPYPSRYSPRLITL
jgi:hypothetical protein